MTPKRNSGAEWEGFLLSACLNDVDGKRAQLLARIPPAAFTGLNERRAWTVLIQAGTAGDNPIGDLAAAGLPKDAILAWADLDRFGARTMTAEAAVMGAYNERKQRAVAADFVAGKAMAADLSTALELNGIGSHQDTHIILPGRHVSIVEAGRQIFALIGKVRRVFYRGGRVHEIVANPDGTRRLDPISPAQFRSRLEIFGKVYAWRSGTNGEPVLKPSLCPEETARALLESPPARELLPNVATLCACPVLAKVGDEMRILGPGWHPIAGGLYVTGGESPPPVPLADAVHALGAMLDDFDFSTPGDRSRGLASLIAPGLRFGSWLNQPLPVDIGEADASQSGKTYRQKCVAAIYREIPNVVVQRTGGVGGLDESLSQKLIDGRPFILFDNLRGRMDSQFLESILTAPGPMPARVPHRGEVQVDSRGFFFQITSNGVETTRDLANRASLVRIRKQSSDYKFKTYPEGDIYRHIVANQAYYLGCVFAVIEEWVANDQPHTEETRHDFREWVQVLDWIVQKIFGAAQLMDGHEDARQRVSDPRRNWLRALCIAMRDAERAGEFYASQIAEFALENDIPPPGVRSDADEMTVARKIGSAMASIFRDANEVEIDGFRIHRAHRTSPKTGNATIIYRFEHGEHAA